MPADLPAFRARLFGEFAVWVHGRRLQPVHSPKELLLPACLLVQAGENTPRPDLAQRLSPASDPSIALKNLRRYLADLRKALEPEAARLIVSEKERAVRFDISQADIDLITFHRAATSANLRLLEKAVTLHSRPLLEGWSAPTANGKTKHAPGGKNAERERIDWIKQKRQECRSRYLRVLIQLFQHQLAARHYQAARRYLRLLEAAGAVPLPEWQALIQALLDRKETRIAALFLEELEELLRRHHLKMPSDIRALGRKLQQMPPSEEAAPEPDPDCLWTYPAWSFKDTIPPQCLNESLICYWAATGQSAVAAERLKALLPAKGAVSPVVRSYVCIIVGRLSLGQRDLPTAFSYGRQAYDLFQAQGRRVGLLSALTILGCAAEYSHDFVQYKVYAQEYLELARALGHRFETAQALSGLGAAHLRFEEYAAARACFEEALTLFEALEDGRCTAIALAHLGEVAGKEKDHSEAIRRYVQAIAVARAIQDTDLTAHVTSDLARAYLEAGDLRRARRALLKRLCLFARLRNQAVLAAAMEGQILLEAAEGRQPETTSAAWAERVAMLVGMEQARRLELGQYAWIPADEQSFGTALAAAQKALPPEGAGSFDSFWQAGRSMTCEQAVRHVLTHYRRPPAP
jgi:DNA-binding SARP family transcriptional activator